jgi:ubiquitin C-terminal hydrolase
VKAAASLKLIEGLNPTEPVDTKLEEVVKAAASLKLIESLNEPANVESNLEEVVKAAASLKLIEAVNEPANVESNTNVEDLLKLTASKKLIQALNEKKEAPVQATTRTSTKNGLVVMTTTSYVNGEEQNFKDADKTYNPLIEIIVPYPDANKTADAPKVADVVSSATIQTAASIDTDRSIISEKFPRKIFGIENLGVQCYSNAAFQMLYSIPEMRKIFTEIGEIGENDENATINLFINRFKEISQTEKERFTIGQDNENTCLTKFLENHRQQKDVQESFMWFLNIFEEESSISAIKNFSSIFRYNQYTDFLCTDKRHVTKNEVETNLMINLSINPNKPNITNIDGLLNNLSKYEEVDKDQHLRSDNCGEGRDNVSSIKYRIKIPDMNRYLIIQLKRFEYNKTKKMVEKIRKYIIPNETITVDEKKYTLTGIICHRGDNIGSGHYVYYECDDEGNDIRLYNDSVIEDKQKNNYIDQAYNNEINTDGYMFLYSRDLKSSPEQNTNLENVLKFTAAAKLLEP